jgi:uridine kinase
MIGDKINLLPEYFVTAKAIVEKIDPKIFEKDKIIFLIGGESGSGKSVLTTCLLNELKNINIKSQIIQLDDYFKLPPKTNHKARLENISRVGLEEVNMEKLQNNLNEFKNSFQKIEKPISDYRKNTLSNECLDMSHTKVLLVEGTYSLYLEGGDFRIFIDRNFIDTRPSRIQRGREEVTEFSERVLFLEHEIVTKSKTNLDFIVTRQFEVIIPEI